MSLALIVLGSALLTIAVTNRLPLLTRRPPTPRSAAAGRRDSAVAAPGRRPRVRSRARTVPARLTEQGRAVVTTLGGSLLIVAFFLALSGL